MKETLTQLQTELYDIFDKLRSGEMEISVAHARTTQIGAAINREAKELAALKRAWKQRQRNSK